VPFKLISGAQWKSDSIASKKMFKPITSSVKNRRPIAEIG
jgi:hypothetical protein